MMRKIHLTFTAAARVFYRHQNHERKTTGKIFLLLTAFAFFALVPFAGMRGAFVPAFAARSAQEISFDRDIRPILAERCLACHGEKKQSGGLRLDAKSFAMRGGQNGPVIVAGKAAESRMYQRVAAENDDERMPPAKRLSAAEIALLKSWIDAGAVWPEEVGENGSRGEGRINGFGIGRGSQSSGQRFRQLQ